MGTEVTAISHQHAAAVRFGNLGRNCLKFAEVTSYYDTKLPVP
jgi:hypothetical protein